MSLDVQYDEQDMIKVSFYKLYSSVTLAAFNINRMSASVTTVSMGFMKCAYDLLCKCDLLWGCVLFLFLREVVVITFLWILDCKCLLLCDPQLLIIFHAT